MRHNAVSPRLMILIGLAASAGCTHNHYYYPGSVPVCDGSLSSGRLVSAPVVAGTYCDVPGVAGTPAVVATNPGRADTIISNRRPPMQIVSQPAASGGWRSRRDAGAATTRISGTVDENETIR